MEAPGPDGAKIKIDEKWLKEYVGYGWADLVAYLSRRAAFADYLDQHPDDPALD